MTKDEIRSALNREDLWPKVVARLMQEFGEAGAVQPFEWPGHPCARGLAVLNGLIPAAPYVAVVPDAEFDNALNTIDTLAGETACPSRSR